jgi:hypothetical protein
MASKKLPGITSGDIELSEGVTIDAPLGAPVDHDQLYAVHNESMHDERMQKLMAEEKAMRDFFEEKVTFSIGPSSDQYAIDPVPCGVNGEHRFFKRGERYTVARKFVEALIRVAHRVKTQQIKDANNVDNTEIKTEPYLVYPIQIWSDPSGTGEHERGGRWFQHQIRNNF